jgi:hypothetical protein
MLKAVEGKRPLQTMKVGRHHVRCAADGLLKIVHELKFRLKCSNFHPAYQAARASVPADLPLNPGALAEVTHLILDKKPFEDRHRRTLGDAWSEVFRTLLASEPFLTAISGVRVSSLCQMLREVLALDTQWLGAELKLELGEQSASARELLRPRWDASRRELWFGGERCKRFRQPTKTQELILSAFEKEGWPDRIDDPLPAGPDDDPRQRLSDAVRKLNNNRYLRFELDGTSEGILWRPERQNLPWPPGSIQGP